MGIIVKSPDEIATMRKAGRVVARVLKRLSGEIRPGMRTDELELISLEELGLNGAKSSFKVEAVKINCSVSADGRTKSRLV